MSLGGDNPPQTDDGEPKSGLVFLLQVKAFKLHRNQFRWNRTDLDEANWVSRLCSS